MNTKKVVIWIAVGLVALLLVGLVLGALMGGRAGYGFGPGMMGGFRAPSRMHMVGGGLALLLFGGLILGGAALLAGGLAHSQKTPTLKDETPLEILKRRYAKGEIDREEFERIKESIQG